MSNYLVFPFDKNTTTVAFAEQWVLKTVKLMDDAVVCPCCGQDAKMYKRKIYSASARALIAFYKYFAQPDHEEWVHGPSYLSKHLGNTVVPRGGDWSKLTHWELLEEKPMIRDDGSPRAGYYRITEDGKQFVLGNSSVPKFVFVYDDRVYGFTPGEKVTIHDCLGEDFNYRELMEGI